jgi:hypothetical protein
MSHIFIDYLAEVLIYKFLQNRMLFVSVITDSEFDWLPIINFLSRPSFRYINSDITFPKHIP